MATHNLTRSFGEIVAVQDLCLEVKRGEVFGFLGPNGAGKTTTVRLLNGVIAPSAGQAAVFGLDVGRYGNEIRRRTGVLTETPNLYEALSGRENLLFFGDLYGVPRAQLRARVQAMLVRLGLEDRADDRVGAYSKGMRQRLALARALLHEPELLFLDEPTSALDPEAARKVTEMIRQLSHEQGRTIFLCTHNLPEAQRLCDRVGVIDQGRLRALGTPQELAHAFWQNQWVEIDLHGPPTEQVVAALGQLAPVSHCEVDNGLLRVELHDEGAVPDLVSAIVQAGGRIHRVAPLEHSLEDIYFRIQRQGAAEPAEEQP